MPNTSASSAVATPSAPTPSSLRRTAPFTSGAHSHTPSPPSAETSAGAAKPARQPKAWITTPAASGPSAIPSAESPRKSPIARGACSDGNRLITSASVSGPTAAFAMPSSARAAPSMPTEPETAASVEATTTPALPSTSTFLRP
jgi:hypothetical protein